MLTRKYALAKVSAGKAFRGPVFSVHIADSDDGPIYAYRKKIYSRGTVDCYPASDKEIADYQAKVKEQYRRDNLLCGI